ncbi:MAG: bile acid:sodium symporter [Gordonia sp. (in: high G+C Gram-positive bacteria)]
MERHQVPWYLGSIGVAVLAGLAVPDVVGGLDRLITPLLGALLFVTFLQVPVTELASAWRNGRFLGALVLVDFVVVPAVVALLFPLVPADQAVRFGVLLVLLCPCVDYVVVFTGLAGGEGPRLLAATPFLLLAQMMLLPVYLWMFLGDGFDESIGPGPFVSAFVGLIVIPLVLAAGTQVLARRHRAGRRLTATGEAVMVPLMMTVLAVVVASQVPGLDGRYGLVVRVLPLYAAFVVAMTVLGGVAGRVAGLGAPDRRAVLFSGVTRNSLVVLPFALALPVGSETASAVVVAQTLVELVAMTALVALVPRLVPDDG